jgi:hypothetical protein
MSLWSFQGADAGANSRSFKTQQRGYVEVDVVLGELGSPTAEAIKGPSAYRHAMPASLERR